MATRDLHQALAHRDACLAALPPVDDAAEAAVAKLMRQRPSPTVSRKLTKRIAP